MGYPSLEDLLAADAERSRQLAQGIPKRPSGNNPWLTPETYPRSTHRDPTADTAVRNVDRERRKKDK